jgi:ribonuclease HII
VPKKSAASSCADLWQFEETAYHQGFGWVAGIDEVGRGPLAGPVVAAAVVLPRHADLAGVTDSKRLSPAQREACHGKILDCAVAVGIGCVEAGEIDCTNILAATFEAMVQAVGALVTTPDYLLIDGPYTLPLPVEQRGIPRGDQRSISIAAASIVAKVYRDRLMCDFHHRYPAYGFDQHKGYGTARHLDALRRLGPCPLHRLSFRGVLA